MPSKFPHYRRGAQADKCRQCGARAADGAQISTRNLCGECAVWNAGRPARELVAREGPAYDQWLRSTREALDRMAAG